MTAYTFDQLITFTRTSAATYVGSNGLVAVTPASRNLLTYTQEFDNAAWTKTRSSITANSTAAPDGTNTADTLNEDSTASSTHPVSVAVTLAAAAHTLSIYVKASGRSWVQISLLSTANAFANFNVSTGALGTVGAAATATITSVGNGWYRCTMTATTGSGSNTVAIYPASADNTVSFTGTGIASLFIWGAQLEAASAASTYTRNNGGVYPPRFDYDPVTRAPRGLLIEEQRTNLLLRSEEFDNASWNKTRASVTANATTSPDGTVAADKLVEDTTASSTHGTNQVFTGTAASHTFTVYAKAGERSQIRMRLYDGTTFVNETYFNLATGAVGAGTGGTITNAGNGWYRCSVTGTLAASASCQAQIFLAVGGSDSYTGDGTSGIFVWGAQLEAGPFATSYIPTVASQVTRTADLAAITAPMFAPWYRQSEGTFVYQYQRLPGLSVALGGRIFASGVGGSNSYGIWVNTATSTQDALTIRDISGDAVASALFTVNTSAVNKGGVAYKANDFAWSSNGGAATTDTSGAVPSLSDQLRLGRAINTDGSYLNGHIQSIDYYPTRLTNAQIQALTA